MKIAIVLFDGVEELDFVGPWETFTMIEPVLAFRNAGETAPEVFTVSQQGGEIRCAKGMRVIADHSFETAPAAVVILVPGGAGTRREVDNPAMLAWIASAAAGATWTTSVCTGSLLLAAAGPARGKTVTTHWGYVDQLRARGDVAAVRDDMRYVRDGQVVTSAGVSAGIDMALWLTGRL